MSNILNQIKVSGVTYDIQDASAIHSLDGYWTSAQAENAITAATNALAEAVAEEMSGKTDVSAFTSYTSSTESVISGKADTTAVTEAISEAVSGKLDTSVFETYSGNVDTVLASKIAGAAWDSQTSHLNFFDNVSATGTPLTYVDGADWVKDSFLKSVTIEDKEISGETVTCLVFVFETESGETETDIPLTDIFDPSNYVNVTTFTAYTASTATEIGNKADTTAMTQAISEATSGKVDTSVYTAYTAATDTVLSGKQDTLSAGTGIAIDSTNTISVTGVPMTIDTQMSDSSTNPVENKTIKNYVDTEVAKKNQVISVSGTTLIVS